MNLLDSSCWIEYFADAPLAVNYAAAIEHITELIVPTITIYEVFKKMLAEQGKEDAAKAAGQMQEGEVVDLDPEIAMFAAKISLETGLALADSVILATARHHRAILWTQDRHFAAVEGVKYFPKHRKA
jgi:predicted nucleic acid-binding protein